MCCVQAFPAQGRGDPAMRVLLVHEYYQQRGGEDNAFETDVALLRDAGHEVSTLCFHNTDIGAASSVRERLQLLKTTVWSVSACRKLAGEIAGFRPDVVHFHNTFPLISPAAFRTARKAGTAVVATLHNYRLICVNASLFRDGLVCEDCLRLPAPVYGVARGCYRGSRGQSAAVAGMLGFHRARRTWRNDVHRFISPSQFLRSKLIEGGLPASSISVRPNPVREPGVGTPMSSSPERFLFVGRLAPNKGIETLLRAWQSDPGLPCLRIAGDGEQAGLVQERAETPANRIQYLGALSHEAVLQEMTAARALVFPSVWYENQPMTILEAFACGLPVIASRLGAIPELVIEQETGLTFEAGNAEDLAEKLRWSIEHPAEMERMGREARRLYERTAVPDVSLSRLLDIYADAIAESRASRKLVPA